MIANSKLWAQARNLVRRNEVHGKEEWRIPTSETFSFDATHSHEIQGSGSFEVEDPDGALLNDSISADGITLHFYCTSGTGQV